MVIPASSRVGERRPSAATIRLGFQHRAVGQRGGDAVLAALALDHVGLRMPGDQRLVLRRLEQREAQLRGWRTCGPASLHAASGWKSIRPGFIPSVTAIDAIGQPCGSSASARPILVNRFQLAVEMARGAAVEAFGGQLRRVGAVDHVAGNALLRRCQRQRHADEAAAEDQEIALVRSWHPAPRTSPRPCRQARLHPASGISCGLCVLLAAAAVCRARIGAAGESHRRRTGGRERGPCRARR